MQPIKTSGTFDVSKKLSCFARVALIAVIAASGATAAQADEYRLGVMDKLRVRVAEWQTAEGSVRDWSAVSGEYTVGASGNLSLPFVGDLPASGKTTTEVATEIGIQMQKLLACATGRRRPSKWRNTVPSILPAKWRPLGNIPMSRR